MTTLEHAFVGADLVLASGFHRRFGWQLAAAGGVAAVLPDWDGVTICWSVPLFDTAHRCWGHGLLPCILVAVFFAAIDYRFDVMSRFARFFVKRLNVQVAMEPLETRRHFTWIEFFAWVVFAILASLSHLVADIVVSGTATLSDWDVKVFWPFSEIGVVYPMVPWGDVGNMAILLIGMFTMLRWKNRIQSIAAITLFSVIGYTAVRGLL